MKINRKDDTLDLGPHWHFDCRLASELPEDNVVRLRFLVDVLAGAVVFGLVLFAAWLGYLNVTLAGSIRDWDRRMAGIQREVDELQRLQQATATLSRKINSAYRQAGAPYRAADLLLHLGRTRPELVRIDVIEFTPTALILRGGVNETSERASRLLGRYLDVLRTEPEIGPHFRDVTLTGLERVDPQGQQQSFEITLRKN
jgi:hypothetical protein